VIDLRLDALDMSLEMACQTAELSLMNALIRINGIRQNIQLQEITITQSEENLMSATARFDRGMINYNQLLAAQSALFDNQTRLEGLFVSLETEQTALNRLLGLNHNIEIKIEYDWKSEKPPEDVEQYITDMLGKSLTIKQLEIDIQIRRIELESRQNDVTRALEAIDNIPMYDRMSRAPAYVRARATLEQAILDRDAANRVLDTALRTLENNQLSLEANIHAQITVLNRLIQQEEVISSNLSRARAELNLVEARFELGRVTQREVDNAAVAVLRLVFELDNNLNSQATLQFRLLNTHLL
jgi:outer membrane protein TolC